VKEIKIATRASKLAMAQANLIKDYLSALDPGISISIVKISTKGDRDKSDFLYESNSVGFFTSEVENALLNQEGDIAVHSLKDLPTTITKGLIVSAIPHRESVCDVIVAPKKLSSIRDLAPNARVGTSSLRRITQLKLLRPDLDCQPLRGNVETRIRKVQDGQIDAIVIAEAGLNRLGLPDHISLILPPADFIPAPGQGALAIQTRQDDGELSRFVSKLDDLKSRITAETERRILAGLHGGCSIPLGVYSYIENETIHIHAILCNLAVTKRVKKTISCPVDQATQAADAITQQILDEGGRDILEELRQVKKA
jgi:hydroxymethylbilane synthase